LAAFLVAALLGAALLTAAEPVSRRDAARLQAKLDRIAQAPPGRYGSAARTTVSEVELNSYLQFEMDDRLPAGVTEPWISFVGEGRVSGRATVDLEKIAARRKSGSMLSPFNYLTGQLPVVATGMLRTRSGVATIEVESVSISGVPVPQWMLQEVVTHYSKSSERPDGVSISQPFELPAGIREIELELGQAILIQ
jgi:hypothetical protein